MEAVSELVDAQPVALPLEIVEIALSFLDLDGLNVAMRVSKVWHEIITREEFPGWFFSLGRLWSQCAWAGKRPLRVIIRDDEHGRNRKFRSMMKNLITSTVGRSLLLVPPRADVDIQRVGLDGPSSSHMGRTIDLLFQNFLPYDVELRWKDWDGAEVMYPIHPLKIEEGQVFSIGETTRALASSSVDFSVCHRQQTFSGHPWIVRVADGGDFLGGIVVGPTTIADGARVDIHPWTFGPDYADEDGERDEILDRYAHYWDEDVEDDSDPDYEDDTDPDD